MARIVLCDDEPHITRALELKLRKAGHAVAAFENGADALAVVREHKPDLVITDCQMPVMTGIELCEAIASDPSLASVATVMLTAKGYEIDENELRQRLRVRRLFHKPFSPRSLVEAVEEVLDQAERDLAERHQLARSQTLRPPHHVGGTTVAASSPAF